MLRDELCRGWKPRPERSKALALALRCIASQRVRASSGADCCQRRQPDFGILHTPGLGHTVTTRAATKLYRPLGMVRQLCWRARQVFGLGQGLPGAQKLRASPCM